MYRVEVLILDLLVGWRQPKPQVLTVLTLCYACSTRARSYSDSLPAIFKRNHQYGEFVDDTSDGSEVLSTDTYYTEDRSDTGNGAERHKRVTDKLPAFSTREHKSPLGKLT